MFRIWRTKRMTTEPIPLGEALEELESQLKLILRVRVVKNAREQAERLETETIAQARAGGCTWGQIGEVYGVTRQAALQRWGKLI